MGLHKFNQNHEQRKLWFKQNKNKITKIATITMSVIVFVVGVILLTRADFSSLFDLDMISTKVGNTCEYEVGHVFEFDYTGSSQEFDVPCNGTYKLETWGAQGGGNETYIGGYGAYATGNANFKKDDKLFVVVGQGGSWSTTDYEVLPATYNGGGVANVQWSSNNVPEWHGSGGGATHIAIVSGTLASIGYQDFVTNDKGYIVAAGGGAAGYFDYRTYGNGYVSMQGGHGGGINGVIGETISTGIFIPYIESQSQVKATQTSPSTLYYGDNFSSTGSFGSASGEYIGGGSGLYGGAGISGRSSGGSSYIGNSSLTNGKMVCYNCDTSSDVKTYTETSSCVDENPISNCSKKGNGYARITLLSTTDEIITPTVELYDGMVPVTYDSNGNTVVADTSTEWYSYGGHRWANAVLVSNTSTYLDSNNNVLTNKKGTVIPESDILQYYVWIPRYRYKLFNVNNGSVDEQMIEIRFQNKDNTKFNGNQNGQWLTHPAFTFGDTELNGFWVAKFEPSIITGTLSCTDELCNVSSLRILPNKYTLSNMTVGNQFYTSRSIEKYFNLNTNQVDSHLIKNMEWGAVAYLSASKYGLYINSNTCANKDSNVTVTLSNSTTDNRCQVWINNTNTAASSGNGTSITGCSSITGASDDVQYSKTSCGTGYEWNGSINKGRSSTTGNLYGIYDMSGGDWEYVMGNTAVSTSTYSWQTESSGLSEPESKYYDSYVNPENDYQNNSHYNGKIGDATREILKDFGNGLGGWFDDIAYFPGSVHVFFGRGGMYKDKQNAGIFLYGRSNGSACIYCSFRPVITKD